MSSLRRSPNSPFWIACLTLPDGRRTNRSTKTSDRGLALRLAHEWQTAADRAREGRFVELLRARFPRSEIKDLSPMLDELRAVKSPREIALIRRASELAGYGMMEAIRSTEPGVYEYQLDAAARYIFLAGGARLEGYRSITASGTDNINNVHYFMNTRQLPGRRPGAEGLRA